MPVISRRRRRWSVLLLLGAVTLPCLAAAPGIAQDTPLRRTLVQSVRIDSVSTGLLMTDIRGVATDSMGRIWVAEWDGFVHSFDDRGAHVRSWELRDGNPKPASGGSVNAWVNRPRPRTAAEARLAPRPAEQIQITDFTIDPTTQRLALRHIWTGSDGSRPLDDRDQVMLLTTDMQKAAHWSLPPAPPVAAGVGGVGFDPLSRGLLLGIRQRRDSVMADNIRLVWGESLLVRTDERGVVKDTVAGLSGAWMRLTPGISSMSSPATAGNPIRLPIPSQGVLVGDGHRTYALHLLAASGDTIRTFGRQLASERLTGQPGPSWFRGFVQNVAYDPVRQEILACRTWPQGTPRTDPVAVDYFNLSGAYIGSLQWPACPKHVGDDGIIYTWGFGGNVNRGMIRGYRYGGAP
jgi:hypothetical protein